MQTPSEIEYRTAKEFPKVTILEDGTIIGERGRPLKPYQDPDGYLRVGCRDRSGKWKTVGVHVLMCLAFHGSKPSSLHMVCHRDGIRDRNVPSNLYWGTAQNNADDCRAHGHHTGARKGELHHFAKLTASDVEQIRCLRRSGNTQLRVAERFGVSRTQISHIENYKRWN